MNTKQEDANLILRLYEQRRDETMRRARAWFLKNFNPQSVQDIFAVIGGEHSADFRMVTSYWDMAAAFVNHGAIDEQMFNDINTEHIAIYAKLQPFLAELRAMPGLPPYLYLKNLELLVMRTPDAEERIAVMRRFMKNRAESSATT
ncbi:MAG: hypothetical protein H0X15_00955 [Acidobacteria bacterium]|jgi:hypothetical protein|nr:hypothetical protein [Acidobacteriota bacterium]MBA4182619.1 hypothetical protein [Acidobacteriota bacterium]